MFDVYFPLLGYLRQHPHAETFEVLNAMGQYVDTRALLKAARAEKLVSCDIVSLSSWVLTPTGHKRYLQLLADQKSREQDAAQQMAQKRADEKRDHRFQLFKCLFSAVIGGAITLFVEHFPAILAFLQSLAH